ncbi:MAG: DUF6671 family protein [Crocinitomicaceae bacterium]
MSYKSFFKGRDLAIATMHGKESVIAPLCENALGVTCLVPENFDTDQLGTFSNEVERTENPIDCARNKCERAMELSGCDIAIASEGSFGNHPNFIFSAADDEIVMLVDQKHNFEIIGRKLSIETNFGGAQAQHISEAISLAKLYKIGTHAMIVRDCKNGVDPIYKGLNDLSDFEVAAAAVLADHNSVWVETDMRAMYNPTRMSVIKEATQNLLEKVKSTCPECHAPGFSIKKAIPGLPCKICNLPTKSALKHQYECQKCNFQQYQQFPNTITTESPQFCDFCNP